MDAIELPEKAEQRLFIIGPLERSLFRYRIVEAFVQFDFQVLFGDLFAFAHRRAIFFCRSLRQRGGMEITHLTTNVETVDRAKHPMLATGRANQPCRKWPDSPHSDIIFWNVPDTCTTRLRANGECNSLYRAEHL